MSDFPNEETQFKKGQSGNPNGRPKGSRNISTVLAELLECISPESVKDAKFIKEFIKHKRVTNADAAAARIFYEGIVKGEQWALKEIADRTEGKPKQAIEHGGAVEHQHSGEVAFTQAATKIYDSDGENNES